MSESKSNVQEWLEAQQKRLAEREIADLGRILETPAGRRTVWILLSRANLFRTSFVRGDSHSSAYNEGWRTNAVDLFVRIMDNYPERFTQMWREANSEKQSQENILKDLNSKEEGLNA